MQERGRLDVAGLAARIILVAECITLVGGGRLDVAGGRANPAGGWPSGLAERIILAAECILLGGGWPSGRCLWQSVSYHAASGLEYPSESCKKRPSDSSEAAIRGK